MAEKYLDDPLQRLGELNSIASHFPLFPPLGVAPRMGGELSNFLKEVMWQMAVLRGQGRDEQAELLRDAALNGIESDELREIGARELATPGTIIREVTTHQSDLRDGSKT